jgi:hypothetical protein
MNHSGNIHIEYNIKFITISLITINVNAALMGSTLNLDLTVQQPWRCARNMSACLVDADAGTAG